VSQEFIVLVDRDIGEFYLTGRTVRFVSRSGERELSPTDTIRLKCGNVTAAELVATWGGKPRRTEEARQAAAEFLRQWPEGPQLD
jgi:hypothetical protein